MVIEAFGLDVASNRMPLEVIMSAQRRWQILGAGKLLGVTAGIQLSDKSWIRTEECKLRKTYLQEIEKK